MRHAAGALRGLGREHDCVGRGGRRRLQRSGAIAGGASTPSRAAPQSAATGVITGCESSPTRHPRTWSPSAPPHDLSRERTPRRTRRRHHHKTAFEACRVPRRVRPALQLRPRLLSYARACPLCPHRPRHNAGHTLLLSRRKHVHGSRGRVSPLGCTPLKLRQRRPSTRAACGRSRGLSDPRCRPGARWRYCCSSEVPRCQTTVGGGVVGSSAARSAALARRSCRRDEAALRAHHADVNSA